MFELTDVYYGFLVSFIVCSIGFNTNNKRYYLTYVLRRVSSFTTYDGTNINNEDRKESQIRKNAQIYAIL